MDLDTVESIRADALAALDPAQVQDRVRGALLGGACGDSLGAPFEGRHVVDEAEFAVHRYGANPLVHTDDTAMTLVVARHVIDRHPGGQGLDVDELARALAGRWRAEPWRGYGTGPVQVFRALLLGVDWRRTASELFDGSGSCGNGEPPGSRPSPWPPAASTRCANRHARSLRSPISTRSVRRARRCRPLRQLWRSPCPRTWHWTASGSSTPWTHATVSRSSGRGSTGCDTYSTTRARPARPARSATASPRTGVRADGRAGVPVQP